MDLLEMDITCPNCKMKIHVPFFRDLEAKAIEEFDLSEISAQDKYNGLKGWLDSASLWELVKYWWRYKRV